MKEAFKVYLRDLKNIKCNIIAIVIIIGLGILPSLYAWFNIKSSWDPYGNLSDIKVGIVNLDKGTNLLDKDINIGDIAVEGLKENKTLDFQFIDEETALKGIKSGDYYATITIAENFSRDIVSAVDGDPKKPKLIYRVNEKKNAVAPKITDNGAGTIQKEISKNFIGTVSLAIFKGLNQAEEELKDKMPIINKFENTLFEIEGQTGNIKSAINSFHDAGTNTVDVVKDVKEQIPNINKAIDSAIDLANSSKTFIDNISDTVKETSKYAKEQLILAQETGDNLNDLLDPNDLFNGGEAVIDKVKFARQTSEVLQGRIDMVRSFVKSVGADRIPQLKDMYDKLTALSDDVSKLTTLLYDMESKVQTGTDLGADATQQLKDVLFKISDKTDELVENMDGKYKEGFDKAVTDLNQIVKSASDVLDTAKKEMPKVKTILDDVEDGLGKGVEVLGFAKGKMDDAEKIIKDVASKLRDLQGNEKLDELLKLLKADAVKESDFFSSPVDLVTERIYPVPNYGSALSPFFTSLSLWVGGTLIASLLTTTVYAEKGEFSETSKYLGRGMTFVSIGILQGFIVTVGDMLILDTYVLNKALFVLSGVFISIVFVTMIYSLCYMFGAAGKALAVVLLVLQISSAGGTFPIEVTPDFFKMLNPFMPFTYAIGLMRELVAGVYVPSAIKDVVILLIYFVVTLILGVIVSTRKSDLTEKISAKMKESGIVER